MNSENEINFKGLNTLRFLSAFAIIFYHCSLSQLDKFPKLLKTFVHNFPLGVDMFFIISGFLIIYLLLKEKQSNGRISLVKFYIRRILRIFPLYFLIVLLTFLKYHITNPEINFSKYLYFCGNFWMIQTDQWTVDFLNPLWSLNIEEHFYLLIPILLFFIPVKKSNYLFLMIILISISFRIYATVTLPYNWMTIYCHTLSRCDLLAFGGLIAYYHNKKKILMNFKEIHFYILIAAMVLIMCLVDSNSYTGILNATFKKYLFAIPMAAIFIYTLFNESADKSLISKIKKNKTLNYLGKISFGLYMYHSLVGNFLSKIKFISDSYELNLLSVFLLTILVSIISYELFEKQIFRFKKKFEVVKTNNSI